MSLRVRHVKIDDLETAEVNPRKITERQLTDLKRAITHYGFVEPLILNARTGRLVGGHQRLRAAGELGLEKVPIVDVDLDDQEAAALNLALNKIRGSWDRPALARILEDMETNLVELTGFDPDNLEPAPESDEAELVSFGASGHSWTAPDDHRVRCPKTIGKCAACRDLKEFFDD